MTADDADLQRLIAAHPALFRGNPPALGGHVSSGWYELIDRLCGDIQTALGPEATAACSVVQIKEKFGELRFYIQGAGSTDVQRLLEAARARSTSICTVCGAPSQIREVSGLYTTLCDAHFAKVPGRRVVEHAVRVSARPAKDSGALSPGRVRSSESVNEAPKDCVDVLYLDFDGVVHPEAVWWSRRRGAFLDAKLAAQGHRLFEHCDLLEALLLPYPDVRIVLSTSWVRTYSYSGARKRLSENLRQRCVGATFHSQMFLPGFEAQPRGVQVLSDVRRRRPRRWLALDDVNDGWGGHLGDVVITDEVQGIAQPDVLEGLRFKLSRFLGAA